jgi:hypothetical protein
MNWVNFYVAVRGRMKPQPALLRRDRSYQTFDFVYRPRRKHRKFRNGLADADCIDPIVPKTSKFAAIGPGGPAADPRDNQNRCRLTGQATMNLPILMLIDAPFSSGLMRYTQGGHETAAFWDACVESVELITHAPLTLPAARFSLSADVWVRLQRNRAGRR